MLRVEVLVHILKHVLNTNLLTISDAPYRIELQTLSNSTLKNKYSCSTRAADEVGSLWVEVGNGQGKHAVMLAVEQSDTVWPDEGCLVLFTGIEDALFEGCSLRRLLTKTRRDNDEGPHAFFRTEVVHIVRTIPRCHHEDGEVGLGDVLHIMEDAEALHLIFLRVHDTQFALIATTEQIAHDGTSGLVSVVRAADDDDALRV